MTPRVAAALAELVEALAAAVRTEAAAAPTAPDRLASLGEAARTLGIGRTLLYRELTSGRLRSVKVGRRRLVPTTAIHDYIEAAGPVSDTTKAGPEAERGRARPTRA